MTVIRILAIAATSVFWASWHSNSAAEQPNSTTESAGGIGTFSQLDTNQDGQLHPEEIPTDRRALFTRLLRTSDEDRNGTLSAAEFAAGVTPDRPRKPLARKAPDRLPGSDELLLLLAMLDRNADGKIGPQEPPAQLQRFYDLLKDRIGTNQQGNIVLRQVARGAPRLTQVARMYVVRAGIDVDLEYALLPEKNWQLVQKLDRPRDPAEILADPEQAMELFHRLDANGDGKVEYSEVPEQISGRFDQLAARADRDGDKMVSEDEFRRFSNRVRFFSRLRPAAQKNRPNGGKQGKDRPAGNE